MESLFLGAYGSKSLPYAWGAVALASAFAAGLASRLVGRSSESPVSSASRQ